MGQHAEDGLDDVLNLLVGQPLLFAQHFLADEAVLDIGVIDGRSELEERKLEGKLFWEVNIKDKLSALVWAADGPINQQLPVIQVLLETRNNSPK